MIKFSKKNKYRIAIAVVLSAPLCFVIALLLILIYLYGIDVLWNGIPEEINRGPGDGFFMLLAPPFAFILWLVSIIVIRKIAGKYQSRENKVW